MTADYDHDHEHDHNMETVALRLILACLERSDHGLNVALRELYDTGCATCWRALILALVSNAATGYELMDGAEAEAFAAPDYQIDPARTAKAAQMVANLLAGELDTAS